MAAYQGIRLTKSGLNALSTCLISGTPLHIENILVGNGYMPDGVAKEDMTRLVSQRVQIPIISKHINDDGTALISGKLTGEQITEGFFVREFGIIARLEGGGPILFAYDNLGDEASYLPTGGGAMVVEHVFRIATQIGNAENVIINVDPLLLLTEEQNQHVVDAVLNRLNVSGSGLGANGWSPIPALINDGDRIVISIADWAGGSGTKPLAGQYIGAGGLVDTPAQAVDIRGAAGPKGDNGTGGTTNHVTLTNLDFSNSGHTGFASKAQGLLAEKALQPRNIDKYKTLWGTYTIGFGRDSITGLVGNNKFGGGVLAGNNKIYGVPYGANYVGIIDYITNKIDTTTISGLTGSIGWAGGTLADDGNIYFVPFSADNVMIVNPSTNMVDRTSITGLTGSNKWAGCVRALNGKIYCIPYNAGEVLIIDPSTRTADRVSITGLAGTAKFVGGVLTPDGYIYCVPYGANYVLIIDPSTNKVDITSISGLTGSTGWMTGALSPDGNTICCMPYSSNNVLFIDVGTRIVDTESITGLTGTQKWLGAVPSSNGLIYGIPRNSESILIVDPNKRTADITSMTGLGGTTKWYGGIGVPDGRIFGLPHNANEVLIIEADPLSKLFRKEMCLSPFMNKL